MKSQKAKHGIASLSNFLYCSLDPGLVKGSLLEEGWGISAGSSLQLQPAHGHFFHCYKMSANPQKFLFGGCEGYSRTKEAEMTLSVALKVWVNNEIMIGL